MITSELADRALLLAMDPVPNDRAAAAELRRLAAGVTEPGVALLAAMDVAWRRVGDLAGERLEVAGRALMLLVMAIDEP
jgi:hypothetical protein